MGRKEIDVRGRSTADAATLYRLIADGATWPTWSPIGSFELEREGKDAREGLGAHRAFRTWPVVSREEIVELVPDRRLSYIVLSGLPICGYRADIDLTPDGDGTLIRWHSTFDPKFPGTGWFYRWFLASFIRRCVRGLATYAASVPQDGRAV